VRRLLAAAVTALLLLVSLPAAPQTDCGGTSCTGGIASANAWTATNTFSGKLVRAVQTVTVADNANGGTAAAFNLTPTGSYIEITCNDAQGCDATMIETSAVEGHEIIVVNISAANVVNFADSAGVSELAGAFAAGAVDSLRLVYTGTTWVELSRSNN
jgi:hypothetical protein